MERKITLTKSIQIILLFFLIVAGLYYGRSFLIPLAFAGILAMLLLPLSRKIETNGINRGISSGICIFVFLLAVSGIIALLVWQVSDLAKDYSQVEQQINSGIDQVKSFIDKKLGIAEAEQQKIIKEQQKSGQRFASTLVSGFMGVLVDIILVLVYTVLFLLFRTHLKKFILKLVPQSEHTKTEKIISESSEVAHKYLTGMFMMIIMLWILYGIGFSLAGVPNAYLFAVLCGLLEIVPFVGNLTGTAITLVMAISHGGATIAIGVLITYGVVQFIQTYVIEPVVVGGEVNINPLFTILALILGEELWGVAGMVLAIPLLGIVKIVFDNVEQLKPYGFLIGEGKKRKEGGFSEKIKSWFSKASKKK